MKERSTWKPSERDYNDLFVQQNPWWATGQVPKALAWEQERPLGSVLWSSMLDRTHRRHSVVLGPRRVGKTTILYQTVRHLLAQGVEGQRVCWLKLDHPLLMRVPLGPLIQTFIKVRQASADRPIYVLLDELVDAQGWDKWLKTMYDEAWPIRLAASSSAAAALRAGGAESGVGRWDDIYLPPYSFGEYLALVQREPLISVGEDLGATLRSAIESGASLDSLDAHRRRFLLTGGFPELLMASGAADRDEQTAFLASQQRLKLDAVERTIYKDIPQSAGVQSPEQLERLLYTLAGQVAGILSPQTLSKELGIAQPTFDRYLGHLERSFLVFTLPNFASTEQARQRRGRKLYFYDGAIRNAALQRGISAIDDSGELGLLSENLAAAHLKALSDQSSVRLYHWRDPGQAEVDLIYDHPTRPLAFEISLGSNHHHRGLAALMERFPRFRGGCYMVTARALFLQQRPPEQSDDGIGNVSIDTLLLCAAAQAKDSLFKKFHLPGSLPMR
jgi:uncharacterized protein